jgi:hypothetical protein
LQSVLDPAQIVAGRTAMGGSGPEQVRAHARALNRGLAEAGAWRAQRRNHAARAEQLLLASAKAFAGSHDG